MNKHAVRHEYRRIGRKINNAMSLEIIMNGTKDPVVKAHMNEIYQDLMTEATRELELVEIDVRHLKPKTIIDLF